MQAVHSDITIAETLDKQFYLDSKWLEASRNQIFAQSWQFISDRRSLQLTPNFAYPFCLLDKYMDDPLVLISDKDENLSCLSNVCTHRGFQIIHHPQKIRKLTCGYHGRRFAQDGQFEFMPEYKETKNFPRPCDHLAKVPLVQWRQFLFASLAPAFAWKEIENVLESKIGFLPIENFRFAPEYTKEYFVKANWALYCDNYLEGFHIPFVHDSLNAMIDYGAYKTELFDYCNVQVGYADDGADAFDLPEGHPDYGKRVTAYYFWLFPNIMMNFYRYGLQINIVKPISTDRCKVSFLFYLHDEEAFKNMEAEVFSAKVEREDEFVVEAVQKGLQSRFYESGRYSPKREKGVHHFHRLIGQFLGL